MVDLERDVAPFCSLPPEAMEERAAWIRREILPHAVASGALSHGRSWSFADTPERRSQLEHLIELESQCCRGPVTFHLVDGAPGTLRLEVRGIDADAKIFEGIGGGEPTGRVPGLAKAGASGLAVSLFVCCALPYAAAALFGAAVAAPLASLDNPLVIVLAAVASAALFWRVRSRNVADPA